jgi:hypothetical protein
MKIQGFKYSLWAINFVIVVGIGLSMTLLVLARDTTVPNVAKELDEKAAKIASAKAGPNDGAVTARDIDVLWTVPIRKQPEVVAPVETPEAGGGPGPTIVSPLERYIVVSGSLGDAFVITYIDPKIPAPKTPLPMGPRDPMPKQLVVERGKPLPDIQPEAIPLRFQWTPFPGGVVFSYDGQEVVLPVVRGVDSAPAGTRLGAAGSFPGPAGQVRGSGRVPGRGLDAAGEGGEGGEPGESSGDAGAGEGEGELTEAREVRPGTWELPQSEKEHITQNAREILESVGVEDYSEGAIRGLKLTSLPGDSLPAQRGFQEGDIIKSVNGQPISSQADLINYSKKMGDRLTVVRVEYYRQGKLMSSTYRVK